MRFFIMFCGQTVHVPGLQLHFSSSLPSKLCIFEMNAKAEPQNCGFFRVIAKARAQLNTRSFCTARHNRQKAQEHSQQSGEPEHPGSGSQFSAILERVYEHCCRPRNTMTIYRVLLLFQQQPQQPQHKQHSIRSSALI